MSPWVFICRLKDDEARIYSPVKGTLPLFEENILDSSEQGVTNNRPRRHRLRRKVSGNSV